MDFEKEYARLISMIDGNDENMLEFDLDFSKWHVEANNDSICPLGEVTGNIRASGSTLEELLINFERAIVEFNE